MFPVSAAYMTAIGKPIKTRRIIGTVGNIAFSDANIVSGTLKIDNRCSDGTELTLGAVYIGQLTCVFHGINLTGEWMGKTIALSEELLVAEDTWEAVPLGVYHVVEAQHQETGVYVVAYDAMDYLDKPWSVSSTTGTPYDYLALISERCDVEFAQTEEEIRELPNGTFGFALYEENDIQTYRDLLFWVAQTMACFATATRDGKIELRQYGGLPVDQIGSGTRWEGSSFSDYVTRYSGVSVVNIDDQSTIYRGLEVDTMLTYNLGANPLLQHMILDTALGNILQALEAIAFTPFNVDRSGCPAYDLGDILTFPDGIGGGRTGCIMAYEYDYHDVYMIDGYGANPALYGAQSKADKELAGLMSKSVVNTFQYYTYTNAEEIELREDYKEILSLRFGSTKQTLVTFQAEIKLENEIEDPDVETIVNNIKYIFNGAEADYHPVETWIEGKHLLHLLYLIPIGSAALNTLKVRMNSEGGVTYISRADLNAVISGQGLVASNTWDGYIDAEDTIGTILPFATEPLEVAEIADTPTVALADVLLFEVSDGMEDGDLSNEPVAEEVKDAPYLNKGRMKDMTWGYIKEHYTWAEVLELFNW